MFTPYAALLGQNLSTKDRKSVLELFSKLSPEEAKDIQIAFATTSDSLQETNKLLIARTCSLLQKRRILLPFHVKYINFMVHKADSIDCSSPCSEEDLQEECGSIHGYDVIPEFDITSRTFSCICKQQEKHDQTELEVAVSVSTLLPLSYPVDLPEIYLEATGITTSQLDALQLMINQKLRFHGPYPLLGAIADIQLFIEDTLHYQKDNLEQKATEELSIPFMPPLRSLSDFQMQTNSLPLSVYTVSAIQDHLRHVVAKATEHKIIAVENILIPQHLDGFIELLREYNKREEAVPAITFGYHGASRTTLESIADDSLLCPGDITRDGKIISSLHGSLYGKGIYLSKNLTKACSYSYPHYRGDEYCQFLVSLVALGKPFQCGSPLFYDEEEKKMIFKYGKCKDGYDSHLAPQQEEYVLFHHYQTLPLLLITLGVKGSRSESQYRALESRKQKVTVPVNKIDPKKCFLEHRIIHNDLSMIILDPKQLNKISSFSHTPQHFHTIFLINQSSKAGKNAFHKYILPSCKDIYNTLSPNTCDAIFYGSKSEHFSVANSEFFSRENIRSLKVTSESNLLDGYRTSIDLILKRKEKFLEESTINSSDLLFTLVVFSDGSDTCSMEERNETIAQYQKIVSANQINLMMRVLEIGGKYNTSAGGSLALHMKIETETIISFLRDQQLYVAPSPSKLFDIVGQLAAHLKEDFLSWSGLSLYLPPTIPPYNGFVQSFMKPPKSSVSVMLLKSHSAILYKGTPPPFIYLNGNQIPLLYTANQIDYTIALPVLAQAILDIKVSALAGKNVNDACTCITNMIDAILDTYKTIDLNPKERVALVKKKKGSALELCFQLNQIKDIVALSKSDKKDDSLSLWLQKVAEMKYGAKALNRVCNAATIATAPTILSQLTCLVQRHLKEPLMPQGEVPISSLSKKSARDHWNEIVLYMKEMEDLKELSVTELLYSFGMVGRCIHVTRTESSNINPWTLLVNYVSHQRADSASSLCLVDIGLPFHDDSSHMADDVLIIPHPSDPSPSQYFQQSRLYHAYLATVFTRNPQLSLPGQSISLAMISFVKAIEQLMNPSMSSDDHFQGIFELYLYIRSYMANGAVYWAKLIQKLYQPQPGLYMTEAEEDDIISVVKILAPLCCSDVGIDLFVKEENKAQLSTIALALLAEVTSRSCRVLVKREGLFRRASPLIRKALNITLSNTSIPDWQSPSECRYDMIDISSSYDEKSGKKYSSRLFQSSFTNASPQGVVACLGFAKILFSYTARHEIPHMMEMGQCASMFAYFRDGFKNITMKQFIMDYVPSVYPMDLQIALYVQGLAHHSAKDRKMGLPSLLSPKTVIQNIAIAERKSIVLDAMQSRFRGMKRDLKVVRLLADQDCFLQTHRGAPRLFTYPEIGKMNETRPEHDQLELLESSGLLRHHCTFPDCPQYLVNLATDIDKEKKTRHGISRHISRFIVPRKYYVPGLHVLCKTTKAKYKTKKEFKFAIFKFLHAYQLANKKTQHLTPEDWDEHYSKFLDSYWEPNKLFN